MDAGETPTGPAGNLVHSLVRLSGSLLAAAETRIDLFATELKEDGERGLRLVVWAVVAALTAVFGVLMAGLTIIIVYWDTHRVAAAVGVTALFVGISVVCGLVLRQRLRERPRLLDATRSELQKDVAAIRSHR
jgi:uncharacterized membrane protein YqjE